jgi:hypothetical protein
MLAGARFDVLAQVNNSRTCRGTRARWPSGDIIVATGVVAVSRIGAPLGGLAGMLTTAESTGRGLGR